MQYIIMAHFTYSVNGIEFFEKKLTFVYFKLR